MKSIQKLTLGLFTVVSLTAVNTVNGAELEINFIDGAVMAGTVTGKANFKGTGNVMFTGSATDTVKVTTGNVKVASAAPILCGVLMNGGSLEATAAMNLPAMNVMADSTLKADADVTLTSMSGEKKLAITGTGVVTPADLSAATTAVDISSTVNVGAIGSKLPAGAVTVLSGGLVDIKGLAANCVPGVMEVKNGATLQVDPNLKVPSASDTNDLFGTLNFNSGAGLVLRNGAVWGRTIVVGTAV
jgi:hypothetical protein